MEVVNAVKYLTDRKMFQEKDYEWIYPLIAETLRGCQITEELIKQHISGKVEFELSPIEDAVEVVEPVHRIKEISKISNVGLIEVDEKPLKFKDGLNVFYGKNGSGKSTIYKSLVNALGNKHIKSQHNIHNGEQTVDVKINVINSNNVESVISYTGKEQIDTNVRVYDTKKMDYLIEPTREQFIIPILNQEVFNHVRTLFDSYSKVIEHKITEITRRQAEIKNIFDKSFTLLSKPANEVSKILDENKFADEEEATLKEKTKTRDELSVDKIKLDVTILTQANNHIKDVLCKYGSIKYENKQPQYKFCEITTVIENYNKHLDEYNRLLEVIHSSSVEGFKAYVDEKWIGNSKWKAFILSGLEFVSSLEQEPDTCPYCQQELSEGAKELLEKYEVLKSEAEREIKVVEKSIDVCRASIKKYQESIAVCIGLIQKIDALEGYAFPTDFTIGTTDQELEVVLNSIDRKQPVGADQSTFTDKLESQMSQLFEKFSSNSLVLATKEASIKTLEDTKKSIQKEIDELEFKKKINEKIDVLKEYVALCEAKQSFDSKKSDLTRLKTKNSQVQNQFSNESYIQLYQEQIQKEYKALEQEQVIKPAYRPKKDECVCSINSAKGSFIISDIFSEGEVRIHSLAELFAEAQLTDYKGVYIFDDPVNSLDETNIDYVANRIKQLVGEGNQVIIFTHNLVFLNELVNTESEKIHAVEKRQYSDEPESVSVVVDEVAFDDRKLKSRKKRIDKLWKEIEELKTKDINEMSFKIGTIYTEISGYLEDYFERKVLCGVVARHRHNIRMGSIPKLYDLNSDGILQRIDELYKKTNQFSNRHSKSDYQKQPTYTNIKSDYTEFIDIIS